MFKKSLVEDWLHAPTTPPTHWLSGHAIPPITSSIMMPVISK
ncbi:MAG: hypothetical protein ACK4RG_06530 [Fimbriimonadales bacterium]